MRCIELIEEEMTERSPAGIVGAIGRLVRSGRLESGSRLPTVRDLASILDLSPTTVAEAWRTLRSAGVIATEGRRGTFVRGGPNESDRFWRVPVSADRRGMDLSTGTPDPRLLPRLGKAFGMLQDSASATSYLDPPVLEPLEIEVRRRLPFEPERLTIVNGAMDALDRIISLRVGVGDRVVVDDPTFAPILDLLDRAGAEVIGVPVDARGMDPAALSDALDLRPALLIAQPRAHNPTGATWDGPRVRELASALDGSGVLVVEDDHSADVSGAPLLSLAAHHPDRVIQVRSFSKAYGPDLRLAAVAGPAGAIDELVRRRQLGAAWSSRLLQAVLLHLLTDVDAQNTIAEATGQYAERRRALQSALGDQGVEIADGYGFNLWMPVRNERNALVALAAQGIGAAPGSSFRVTSDTTDHLRLTVSSVTGGFDDLATRLADASFAGADRGVRA